MTTRTHAPPPKRKIPAGPHGWNQLLSQAIRRAESLQDPRLAGLRKAMLEGRSEQALRLLGILSETDIEREFPVGAK